MNKSNRLQVLLNTLSPKAQKHLSTYLLSPYCVNRKDLLGLYELLLPSLQRKAPWPDNAQLHQALFPQKKFNDLRIRGLLSDLHGVVEDFLVWEDFSGSQRDHLLRLTRFYRAHNRPKAFLRSLKKMEQYQARQAFSTPEDIYAQLQLEEERMKFLSTNKRGGDLRLQEVGDLIDQHFLLQKLRHACTQLTHQRVYEANYDQGLLPYVLNQVESGGFLKIPAIALYYYCYRFLSEADSLPFFQQFRAALSEQMDNFPKQQVKDLYLVAINFCIRKMNAFDAPHTEAGFELYQDALRKGVLLENGRLSRFTFNNIVGFANRQKAFDWTIRFIEDYQDLLEEKFRESTVQFNYARLAYAQKDYDRAVRLLQTTSFKDLLNNLIAKTMLLKIFYEQEEWDLLDAQLSNFKSYIRRQKLSPYHLENFKAIIRLTQKLLNLPPGPSPAREALRLEIQSADILSERRWLLEVV